MGRHLTDQNLRAGAGKVGQTVVFCQLVPPVAQFLYFNGQCYGVAKRLARRLADSHRRLVHDAEFKLLTQM